eukprot:6047653-Amphidinium_carterae.1
MHLTVREYDACLEDLIRLDFLDDGIQNDPRKVPPHSVIVHDLSSEWPDGHSRTFLLSGTWTGSDLGCSGRHPGHNLWRWEEFYPREGGLQLPIRMCVLCLVDTFRQ